MTNEVLTALGAKAESPVGDGPLDVPRSDGPFVNGPYGGNPRFPVGALHEAPADPDEDPTAGGPSGAPAPTAETEYDRRAPSASLRPCGRPQTGSVDRERAAEGVGPYGGNPRFPVGALHEAPADPDEDPTASGPSGAPAPTAETARSAQAEGLSFRTSDRVTGVGIRLSGDEETDCTLKGRPHASVATLARNDSVGEDNANSEFRIPNPELNSELLRAHFDRLCAQGEALRREFPAFDLAEALRDADFLRLTAPGMGIDARRAWLALHPEELQRRAAQDSAAALARSLSSGAGRPREGGGQGGARLDTDYRRLPRAEQQRLKQRIYDAAALGEKIYP